MNLRQYLYHDKKFANKTRLTDRGDRFYRCADNLAYIIYRYADIVNTSCRGLKKIRFKECFFCMSITERIFDLARAQNKRQSDIVRALNVRANTVSEWKSGKRSPTLTHCVTLADYFGVSLDYLITGREPRGAPVQQIIGNNNSNNTAIAGGAAGGVLTEYERELITVAGAFDMRRKNELLNFAYQIEKQIKDEGGF